MKAIDIIKVIERQFGRQSHSYMMQLINDALIDIANKRKDNEETAITSLMEGQRYYPLPKNLLATSMFFTFSLPNICCANVISFPSLPIVPGL